MRGVRSGRRFDRSTLRGVIALSTGSRRCLAQTARQCCNGAPVRVVGRVHVGFTGGRLRVAGCSIASVTFRTNCDDPDLFVGAFGGLASFAPGDCHGGLARFGRWIIVPSGSRVYPITKLFVSKKTSVPSVDVLC